VDESTDRLSNRQFSSSSSVINKSPITLKSVYSYLGQENIPEKVTKCNIVA